MRDGQLAPRCGRDVAAIVVALTLAAGPAAGQPLRVGDLRAEYQRDPIGLGEPSPRLSWTLAADRRGTMQRAYEIRVAEQVADLARHPLWDSGKLPSDASTLRPYAGPALRSRHRYYWQVRAWDAHDAPSAWSTPAFWEMGLLAPADWSAQWITPNRPEDTTRSNPSPMLRSTFTLRGPVASARAYVTGLGLYDMELNGRRVGDRLFTPGWTDYAKRVQYQTYDVTALLRAGANAVGVTLGDGWYRGRLGFTKQRNTYGTRLALLAQIVVRYADGREQVIATGPGWKASTGPIRFSDIYDGERYDARLEQTGWSQAGYDDASWGGVQVIDHPKQLLIAQVGPPVRRIEERRPVRVFRTPAGETVFDMGQNMVGWVRLRARGPRGTVVRLRHAEVLDQAGNVYTANLRTAKATTEFVLKGVGDEVYEPHFTFQGFRYVAVEGFPGAPDGSLPPADALVGIVIHSDMPRTGTFATSDSMLNRLQQNITWGQRGNFLDVPTDTPARDERLGWTGDAEAFAPTAAFNYQVAPFFTKWLGDVTADQKPNGSVPDVIPDVLTRTQTVGGGSSGWGDAATIVPWTMYLAYGDARLLEQQYPSMRRWVDYEREAAGPSLIWATGHHYGDWLDFASTQPGGNPGRAATPTDLVATAFLAHSADLVSHAAAVLGRADEARRYRDLFERVRMAFQGRYVDGTGRLASNTQTAYALALEFDLLPDSLRQAAGDQLAANVRKFGHLTTGFLGTPHLTDALVHTGHVPEA
ncbi:MAG TPA: family 78 glycoside hydrolase catalytic domain, partial [Gemmatirosa sp.]